MHRYVKKQSVSATLKTVPFLSSPQFRLKCNRFLKLSYKHLLKTADAGTLLSQFFR
ncbi:protein of unknown function [Agrobacterium pusense]|uniref:Uncharacterized protein n=1 Tax=Agrobacterium pusense TaxID=648995 RepID=U4PU63_9HYPH|nr:protein of unknown function [Agrobacterium pusense]